MFRAQADAALKDGMGPLIPTDHSVLVDFDGSQPTIETHLCWQSEIFKIVPNTMMAEFAMRVVPSGNTPS